MRGECDEKTGSFRDHIDELLQRLNHEGVVGAGTQVRRRSGRLPKSWTRNPAFHNRALFDWSKD